MTRTTCGRTKTPLACRGFRWDGSSGGSRVGDHSITLGGTVHATGFGNLESGGSEEALRSIRKKRGGWRRNVRTGRRVSGFPGLERRLGRRIVRGLWTRIGVRCLAGLDLRPVQLTNSIRGLLSGVSYDRCCALHLLSSRNGATCTTGGAPWQTGKRIRRIDGLQSTAFSLALLARVPRWRANVARGSRSWICVMPQCVKRVECAVSRCSCSCSWPRQAARATAQRGSTATEPGPWAKVAPSRHSRSSAKPLDSCPRPPRSRTIWASPSRRMAAMRTPSWPSNVPSNWTARMPLRSRTSKRRGGMPRRILERPIGRTTRPCGLGRERSRTGPP